MWPIRYPDLTDWMTGFVCSIVRELLLDVFWNIESSGLTLLSSSLAAVEYRFQFAISVLPPHS